MQTLLEQTDSQPHSLSDFIAHSPELELIVWCARSDIDDATSFRIHQLLRQSIDWQQVISLAQLHAVLPLVYTNLNARFSSEVPADSLGQLKLRFRQSLFQNLRLSRELVNLLEQFHAHGVSAIPFKGPVLALTGYGDLSLRIFADLDILVKPSDYPKVREILRLQGYTSLQSPWLFGSDTYDISQMKEMGECTFIHPEQPIYIDLHNRLIAGFMFDLTSDFEAFRDRVHPTTLFNRTFESLRPEDLLIYLCVHGTKELWAKLGWVCDVAQVLRSYPNLNWDEIWQEAKRLRVEKMVILGLLLVQKILYIDTHKLIQPEIPAVVHQLAYQIHSRILHHPEHLPKGLTWERFWFHWCAMSRKRDRIRYGFKGALAVTIVPLLNLFRPSHNDQVFFPLPKSLYLCYYAIRPVRLLIMLAKSLSNRELSQKNI
jgi:hypothetical protein